MKTFSCVADLESQIGEAVIDGSIKHGVFGNWSGGGEVVISGYVLTKGMFPRYCIRWLCPTYDSVGLFGKGLAGYVGVPYTFEQIKHLRKVK